MIYDKIKNARKQAQAYLTIAKIKTGELTGYPDCRPELTASQCEAKAEQWNDTADQMEKSQKQALDLRQ